jgi:hypothetical protein
VGELIACDIGPKYPVVQRHGTNYPFIFLDIISKMLFLYSGKQKDDLCKEMVQLYKELDRNGYTWKAIQCDSEKILMTGRVQQFLDDKNIILRFSTPYKHGQNGDVDDILE